MFHSLEICLSAASVDRTETHLRAGICCSEGPERNASKRTQKCVLSTEEKVETIFKKWSKLSKNKETAEMHQETKSIFNRRKNQPSLNPGQTQAHLD